MAGEEKGGNLSWQMSIMISRMTIMTLKSAEIFNPQKIENHIPWVSFLSFKKSPFYVIVEVGIHATNYIITFWRDGSLLLCLSQAYLAPSWYLNGPSNEVVKADILNAQTALPGKALLHRNVRIQCNFIFTLYLQIKITKYNLYI